MNSSLLSRLLAPMLVCMLSMGVHAQTQVALRIDHKAGQADVVAPLTVNTPSGEAVEVDRLEYYLSMFTIVHDGGQETAIDGAYVLGDAFADDLNLLGEVSGVENVEAVKFMVGIDPTNNHADPALWPEGHPLALQVPSMHWGWSAGYRFVALEGAAAGATLEIHALGDDNHMPGEMEVLASIENGMLVLDVEADVLGFFHLLTVGDGLINHSEDAEAILVCNNLANRVFRTPGANSVAEQPVSDFDFKLIPVEGGAKIQFNAPLNAPVEVELLDLLGRSVGGFTVASGVQAHLLRDVLPGAFLISVKSQESRFTRRWIQG